MSVPLTLTQLFTNNAVSLLTAPISASGTSLNVMSGLGALYPQPSGTGDDYFLITLEDQAATVREIIKVTNRVGDTLFFTLADRGLEGTTARAWTVAAGADTLVDHRVTAETMTRAMSLPQSLAGSSWINGENTLNTDIPSGMQLPISLAVYSNINRTFKFIVTIVRQAVHTSRAFEVMLTISGDLTLNAEVVDATQYATVGPKLQGELFALVDPLSKTLSLEWLNSEADTVTVQVTRIQHFPV